MFSKRLAPGVSNNMVRPITKDEIKATMFDIGEDKSPGSDGFTSAFFKSCWDNIGEEVCDAIFEFFASGYMLKELNNTVISLLAKVTTSSKITDYRHISCCNVLYKCISKILADRMKEGLMNVVSENQSAFVPGRCISDNILLT